MTKPTILVVDDTPENIQVLTGVLSTEFRVKAALDGERALEIAAAIPSPDLILLDIMMPDMDGYEVIDRLKSNPATDHIPVIFVTAMTHEVDEETGLNLGAVDYITKPISPAILLARVKTQLALYKKTRELEMSYQKLQRLEELRDNLVHMLVHDMRTPVSIMQMSLNLLKDEIGNDLNEENLLDLDGALNGTENLIKMIGDLLDVSRFESNQMPLNLQKSDLASTLKQAIDKFGVHATEGRIYIQTESEKVPLRFDREVISRVITNLVGNAVKFSPTGTDIKITVKTSADNVEVSVHDSGPGIPIEYQRKIFEKFGQATSKQGKIPTTGLGLTFCKLAVEAHHGEVGVDSEPGKGSRFWFSLPLTPVEVDIETERTDEQ